jgi:hypothetical protein
MAFPFDDGDEINFDVDDADYESYSEREPSEFYTSGIVPEGMTFDSMGNMVPVGDPSAASADPTGEAQAYLNAIQGGKDVNLAGALKSFKGLLSGSSSMGSLGQMAGIAGLSALFNKLTGGGLGQSGQGVYKGYQGSIPKYTASRQQYALPVVPLSAANQAKVTDQGIKSIFGQEGFTNDRAARTMYKYGLTPERVANVMNAPVADVQSAYHKALGPNQGLLGGMYGPYNQTTHPARGDNTGARGMDYEYRRPGSGGITYFSPMQYNKVVPPAAVAPPAETVAAPVEVAAAGGLMGYARGGIANLGDYSDGGRLLRGPGDGVSDSIPATIAGKQPARLADGEFVIPARIVSEIGNGSTEAGAKKLYAMMDRVQNVRKKSFKNVAANTKADKYLPR